MKQEMKAAYEDIPGTYLFNSDLSHRGYHLNMFCLTFMKEKNRKEFLADQEGYLDKFTLTDEQRRCVLEQDWLGMLNVGGNIYYTIKLAATHGLTFQYVAAEMAGMSQKDYRKMMVEGGRSPDGNRSKMEKT